MQNCPFCQINQERSRIIKNGKLSYTMLSNPRLMLGHTLVIPKRHVEFPWELTSEELQEIFGYIWWLEQRLIRAGLATGCDIRQNYRPFLPQGRVKIDHLHFHVLPRTNEDELFRVSMRFEKELFKDLPEDEREQMTNLLAE